MSRLSVRRSCGLFRDALRRAPAARILVAGVALLSMGSFARADLVRLKSGGEVRGQVDRNNSGPGSAAVSIETLCGAVVVIERDEVQFVSRRPLLVEEYETIARRTPSTVPAQWELAEWCRKNRLNSQRETHLARILEIDPGHEEAHHALGHTLHRGEWTTRDDLMTSQGYVKYKGKYVTQQELDLLQKSKAELDAERKWYTDVRRWHGWLTGRDDDRRQQGYDELKKINDPTAIPALSKTFRDDASKDVRALYVAILEGMPNGRAVSALAYQALFDADYEVRYQSLIAIQPASYAAAAPLFVAGLRSDRNVIVCRAGQALGRVGDDSCVPKLIDALITSHRYKVAVPEKRGSVTLGGGGLSMGASNNVAVPPEIMAMIASGQVPAANLSQGIGPPERVRIVTIKYDHQNADVLHTLQKLTGESFGYEERTWNLWWTSKKATGDPGT